MNDSASTPIQPVADWRFKTGIVLFILSIVLPPLGVTLVATLGLSAKMVATLSGVILVGTEVLGIISIAMMGKTGYAYIKKNIFRFIKQYGPPREVSRRRYTIGLVMFIVPILFGWLSVYTAELIPGFINTPLPYAIGGDFLFLASLFVLGGAFWDKIRALFVYDAETRFSVRNGNKIS